MKRDVLQLLQTALACAVMIFVGLVSQANADLLMGNSFTAQWEGQGFTSGTGQVQFQVAGSIASSTVQGGLMKYTYPEGSGTNSFYSMCIDLSQYVDYSNSFTVSGTQHSSSPGGPAIGEAAANALGWLWNTTKGFNFLPDNGKALFTRVIELANTSTDPANLKNIVAGALQLTTWKLVYDGDNPTAAYTLKTGQMKITQGKYSDEYNLAQSFLTAIKTQVEGEGIAGWNTHVTALISQNQQDQLILQHQQFEVSPVPEPATMIIWSVVAAAGCAMSFYRRQPMLKS